MLLLEKLKKEYHNHILLTSRLENDPVDQEPSTNRPNHMLYQSCVLSHIYLPQRTNESSDEPNALKFKIILVNYTK